MGAHGATRVVGEMNEKTPLQTSPARSPLSTTAIVHIAFACLTALLEGYNLCVLGSLIIPVQRDMQICFPCKGGTDDEALAECTCWLKQFLISSTFLGCMLGGLAGGIIADKLGRRTGMMIASALFM